MQTFYVYDPVTFEYAGTVQCKNQPADSTTSAPVAVLNGKAYDLSNPTYSKDTDTWHGTNSDYDLQNSVSGLSKQVANIDATLSLLTHAMTGQAMTGQATTGKEAPTNV